jgi:hypothetical protein
MIHAPGIIAIDPDDVDLWMHKIQHPLDGSARRLDILCGRFHPGRMVHIVFIFYHTPVATTL